MNRGIFDDFKHRDRVFRKWVRKQWLQCCDMGLNRMYVLHIPRRWGKSRILHTMATRGFPPSMRVAVVHTCERSAKQFRAMGEGDYVSFSEGLPDASDAFDVILIDEGGHVAGNVVDACQAYLAAGKTVVMTGTSMEASLTQLPCYHTAYHLSVGDMLLPLL